MITTPVDTPPRAQRLDGALSARAVLEHFNERGRALLGADQADAANRIAKLLAHEADLSAAWHGLPGTDHPRHWQADAGDEAALSDARSGHRRLDVHLPLWWTMPLAVRERVAQHVVLPLGADADALRALALRHLPADWFGATVHVLLDVEARVYWGARGAVHPHARARHACAQRAEAGRPSLRLFTLVRGEAEGPLAGAGLDPEVALKVHPGVGWLVALPVLRFERELTRGERWRQRVAHWWHDLRSSSARPSGRDRDPTFAKRLADDEAWWAGRLGAAPLAPAALARAARAGAVLRPASRPALAGAAQCRVAHAVVIHGGLSSVRSGFEAALDPAVLALARAVESGLESAVAANVAGAGLAAPAQAGGDGAPSASRPMPRPLAAAIDALATAAVATPRGRTARPPDDDALWPGLPALDRCATWRFDHDTFLGIARNVRQLVDAVRTQCVEGAPADAPRHVVLLAHSRGGNVARFALPALRRAFGNRGWTFAAVTLGSPHLGTDVFARVGQRWHGLATGVGGLRHLGAPWMDRAALAELVNLERGLAYDVPRGFHDVEPAGVARMMRGRPADELPPGMWLVGSHWGPGSGLEERAWDWLFEDVLGAEDEGDGLVKRHSALGGHAASNDDPEATRFDASPTFHTHYLVHEATRARIARMLGRAIDGGSGA